MQLIAPAHAPIVSKGSTPTRGVRPPVRPRGLASIVFAVILIDDTGLPHLHTLLLAITVTIALAVYAHGLMARPLTKHDARWWNTHRRDTRPTMESVPAPEQRLRGASRTWR